MEFLAALIVYISILEQQAKYGDALEILSGTLGSLLVIEVDKLRIQVLSEAFTFVLKIKTILFVLLFSWIYEYYTNMSFYLRMFHFLCTPLCPLDVFYFFLRASLYYLEKWKLDKNERMDDFLLKDSQNGKGKIDNVDEGGILVASLGRVYVNFEMIYIEEDNMIGSHYWSGSHSLLNSSAIHVLSKWTQWHWWDDYMIALEELIGRVRYPISCSTSLSLRDASAFDDFFFYW